MERDRPFEAPLLLRIVAAPAAFRDRLRSALPDASLIFVERATAASIPEGQSGIAILYERGIPERGLVAALGSRLRTLVVSEQPRTEDALACLDDGADGYLGAAIDAAALRHAVLGIAAGELAFTREVLGLWLRLRPPRDGGELSAIAQRDRRLIALIGDGATDKEIAAALGLTKSTVQKQIARLRRQIGARNRAAAVAMRGRLGA